MRLILGTVFCSLLFSAMAMAKDPENGKTRIQNHYASAGKLVALDNTRRLKLRCTGRGALLRGTFVHT